MSIRYQEAETTTALDALMEADRICLFWEMFEKLGDDCKQVMRMTFEERSEAEIQAKLAFKNEGSVKQKRFKCKNQLAQLIQADPRYAELTGS
ncbi:MAG: hypothetical protein H6592_14270 [Flavobacteriales bacterium]|nr:hypothetical protein [Flavobacteriales bacterium]